MNGIDNRYAAKDVAGMLGVEPVTIRKWASALEQYGYIIERSDGKNRSFSDMDVMVLRQLTTLRQHSGMSVETAAEIVAAKHLNATKQIVRSDNSGNITNIEQYDERYNNLVGQVSQLTQLLVQQQESLKVITDPNHARIERLNAILAERRVQQRLEREALQNWNMIPDNERLIRISLFKRVEDVSKRQQFIANYVNENFEKALKMEFDIEEL